MTDFNSGPQQQGTHHFVLTVQKLSGSVMQIGTWEGHCTPPPGLSRHDVYRWLMQEHNRTHPRLAGGAVIFFDLAPNHL